MQVQPIVQAAAPSVFDKLTQEQRLTKAKQDARMRAVIARGLVS